MVTSTQITAEQLAEMPDDDSRWDLVQGEIWRMSLPKRLHGKVAMTLGWLLTSFVREHNLGEVAAAETGFVLARNPDTVLGPDVAFVRAARVPPAEESHGYWTVAPDLAVEIFSPGDRAGKMAIKVEAYLEAGVRLVWVVYPERQTVVVHAPTASPRTLTNDDVLDGGEVLPGFSCSIASLWA